MKLNSFKKKAYWALRKFSTSERIPTFERTYQLTSESDNIDIWYNKFLPDMNDLVEDYRTGQIRGSYSFGVNVTLDDSKVEYKLSYSFEDNWKRVKETKATKLVFRLHRKFDRWRVVERCHINLK